MAGAVIALGANLGDARAALAGAIEALRETAGIRVISESSVYVTAPVGGVEQPDYVNAVVTVETSL
ncbi:MAG: 2-amino-4-hydroxy-6-hydroxymethyldihydropteridine diphosphokinase, partial [Actinomycetota bacterium]